MPAAVLPGASAGADGAQGAGVEHLVTTAEFRPRSAAAADDAGDGDWQRVALPDGWRQRGTALPEAAQYRIELPVAALPTDRVQGLQFTHVSARVTMHLNGRLLYERGRALAHEHAIRTLPLLVEVPPTMLQPGRNVLLLEVQHGRWQRAGLSVVAFGDLSELERVHRRSLLWRVDGPQIVNLLAMAVSVMLVLMWGVRRSEVAVGLFGALMAITSFRGYGYFAETVFVTALADWMQFAGVLWGVVLLLLFAWRHAEVAHPRAEQSLVRAGLGLTLLAGVLALAWPQGLFGLRLAVYPLALLGNLLANGVLVGAARRLRRAGDGWIASGSILIFVGGLHDFVFITGRLPIPDTFWMPYLGPLLMGAYGVQLVARMLRAMTAAEQLSGVLEQRVAQRTLELAAANEAKDRFLAVASHDLRQPLNAVSLLVGLLRERIQYPEVRALVDKVQASVDGMAALVRSLLDLSRLDADGLQPRLEAVSLAALFANVRDSLAPLAHQRGLRLRFAATRAVVHSDRAMLESLLRNLVGNAIRYTPRGTVLVGVRRQAGGARLQVIDTGVGIAPDEQPRIFAPFFRGRGAAVDDAPGAGLGLTIVQRTADALGHRLAMRSVPGRGTCIQVDLPLAASSPTAPPVPVLVGDEGGRRLLTDSFVVLVEDDAAAREAMAALLHQWGCLVLTAASAGEALRALGDHLRSPDLALCDFHLGEGPDGLTTIAQLREAVDPSLPALLVSAEVELARRAAEGRLPVPVLVKPFQADELARAMVALLRRQQLAEADDPQAPT